MVSGTCPFPRPKNSLKQTKIPLIYGGRGVLNTLDFERFDLITPNANIAHMPIPYDDEYCACGLRGKMVFVGA